MVERWQGMLARHLVVSVLTGLVGCSLPRLASADFAAPPESPYRPERGAERESGILPTPERAEPESPFAESRSRSTLRVQVGPAVLLQPAGPGLLTALDIGGQAVGARLSGAWLRAETQQGLSAYTGELWIDFRHRYQLHPIVGAGASWLRGGALGQADSVGAGMLRGALEYELPIVDADARVSLDAIAFVPAIGSERTKPWGMVALLVGAGF